MIVSLPQQSSEVLTLFQVVAKLAQKLLNKAGHLIIHDELTFSARTLIRTCSRHRHTQHSSHLPHYILCCRSNYPARVRVDNLRCMFVGTLSLYCCKPRKDLIQWWNLLVCISVTFTAITKRNVVVNFLKISHQKRPHLIKTTLTTSTRKNVAF